jgi:DNA-binding transcriptional LysR family regulator
LLNDPLFLKNPKGVVPTARAVALIEPIGEILARVRSVLASAEAFGASRSTRSVTMGATDGISAVILRPLLATVQKSAPGVNLGIRNLLPPFEVAFKCLDERVVDIAIAPMLDDIPARFAVRELYTMKALCWSRGPGIL